MAYDNTTKTFTRSMRFETDSETENGDDMRQVDFDRALDDLVGGMNAIARSAAKYDDKAGLLASGVDYNMYSAGAILQAGNQLFKVVPAGDATFHEITASGLEGDGNLKMVEAGVFFSTTSRAQEGDTLGSNYIFVEGSPYVYDATGSDLTTGDSRTWTYKNYFSQSVTGSVDRTYQDKLQDVLSVKDFGAVGDGVTDDTTALQNAMNYAASISGARIVVPRGVYRCTGQLSLNTPVGVSFIGEGKDNTHLGGSIIEYTGTASPFIELIGINTRMFTWEGIDIQYTNAGFTGTLVRMPCFDAAVRKCHFSGKGTGVENAAYLLDIDQAVDVKMEQVRFGACQWALRGMTSSGYANAVVLSQCQFNKNRAGSIKNPGQGWTIQGCSFEPNINVPAGEKLANAIVVESGISPQGLNVIGCWFGDLVDTATSVANQWIDWRGDGLFVSGNYFNGAGFHSVDAIRVSGTARGITIVGNHFAAFGTALDIGTGLASEVVMMGNNYNATCDAFVTGTPASGTVFAPEWAFANPSGRFDLTGGLRLSDAIESAESTDPILYASNDPASIIQADYPDGSASDKRAIVTHQHDTQSTWKARISAIRGAFANEVSWLFSALAGTETDVMEIDHVGVKPAADDTFDLGLSGARWNDTFSKQFRPGDGVPIWTSGTGTPEGAVTAGVGSLYTDRSGGASAVLYVKESGSGNTGWVAK